jgi:hypothetical protein
MKLYHGSNIIVNNPRILVPARALDFGAGFYTTSNYNQAARWAKIQERRRRNGKAVVSAYEFRESEAKSNLSILEFAEPNGDWLDFVVANRLELPLIGQFDVVIGPVANDNTLPVLDDYIDGRYTKDEAVARLLPQKLVDQYAFLTQTALGYLFYDKEASNGDD